ncbi:MAG TPA: hypothetical protein VFO77_03775, partial [Actinoplanes sp.]|nr:hypothetical protein [Actinoplanes sp.]
MLIRHPAAAVLSAVVLAVLQPVPAQAAPPADGFATVTRDGVGLRHKRVPVKVTPPALGEGSASSDFDGDGADDV